MKMLRLLKLFKQSPFFFLKQGKHLDSVEEVSKSHLTSWPAQCVGFGVGHAPGAWGLHAAFVFWASWKRDWARVGWLMHVVGRKWKVLFWSAGSLSVSSVSWALRISEAKKRASRHLLLLLSFYLCFFIKATYRVRRNILRIRWKLISGLNFTVFYLFIWVLPVVLFQKLLDWQRFAEPHLKWAALSL